jgi:hypothetical protein
MAFCFIVSSVSYADRRPELAEYTFVSSAWSGDFAISKAEREVRPKAKDRPFHE